MLEWIKIRDEITCEVYYKLWDENLGKYVVQINQIDRQFRVQVLNHQPFHAKRLKVAKEASQHIYENVMGK